MNSSKHGTAASPEVASARPMRADGDEAQARVRKAMAIEERQQAKQAERRMTALYRSAVLQPGHFSHWTVQRQQLIDAFRELQRIAGRGPSMPAQDLGRSRGPSS